MNLKLSYYQSTVAKTNYVYKIRLYMYILNDTNWSHSGFSAIRINLSPFTKDFRAEEHIDESITIFLWPAELQALQFQWKDRHEKKPQRFPSIRGGLVGPRTNINGPPRWNGKKKERENAVEKNSESFRRFPLSSEWNMSLLSPPSPQ